MLLSFPMRRKAESKSPAVFIEEVPVVGAIFLPARAIFKIALGSKLYV